MTYIVLTPINSGRVTWIDEIDFDLSIYSWFSMAGYVVRSDNGSTTRLSRTIMERILNRPLLASELVDHRNGDTYDNTRQNLRVATPAQNVQNSHKRKGNASGVKGVYRSKNRYFAMIAANGQRYYLGCFPTPEEAYDIYCKAVIELHGEFASPEVIEYIKGLAK